MVRRRDCLSKVWLKVIEGKKLKKVGVYFLL